MAWTARAPAVCRHEGIVQNLYYPWSKKFLEAARSGWPETPLAQPTSDEVKELRRSRVSPRCVIAVTLVKVDLW
jgi:transposase-like protein